MQCMIFTAITDCHILEIMDRRRQFKTQKIGPSYLGKPLIYCRGFIVGSLHHEVGNFSSCSTHITDVYWNFFPKSYLFPQFLFDDPKVRTTMTRSTRLD